VDGTHCCVHERKHATLPRDPSLFSFKSNSAGFAYEIGLSIYDSNLIWVAGPYDASVHDLTIARQSGLVDAIPDGKRAIADSGYIGEPNKFATRNSEDPEGVRKLKYRALARHETFNQRIKRFACLSQMFRHNLDDHKAVFEAICVIVQYQMDNGEPLFDV
jgi:hypothetical protein